MTTTIDPALARADAFTPLDVLMCVDVVCRERAPTSALLHIGVSITAFACPPLRVRASLEDATVAANVHLLRRLLAEEIAMISGLDSYQQQRNYRFLLSQYITRAACHAVAQLDPIRKRLLECLKNVDPSAVGASDVITAAAAANDLALIEWLHSECSQSFALDFVDSSAAAAHAAGNGNIVMLEWLVAHRWSRASTVSIDGAIANRHLSVLHWLERNAQVQFRADDEVFSNAAALGDLAFLQWLYQQLPIDPATSNTGAGDGAACNGHVHILNWLLTHHPDDAACSGGGCSQAARNGHLKVMHWLDAHFPKWLFWMYTLEAAAAGGHLAIVRFLLDRYDPKHGVIEDLEFVAAQSGNLDVLKLVLEHTIDPSIFLAAQGAAASGNLAMVQWLHTNHNAMVDAIQVLSQATRHGHMHILEFLLPLVREPIMEVITAAAHTNNIDMLAYLHATLSSNVHLRGRQQGLERWSVSINGVYSLPLFCAALNGNMDVIHWLVAHGYSECSASAMDQAAANGHLAVVKWLHANRLEGCTTGAVNAAVSHGHADVVAFLLQHRSEGCTASAATNAIEKQRDALLIHLLFMHRRDLIDIERVRAHAHENEGMQRWLRHVVDESAPTMLS